MVQLTVRLTAKTGRAEATVRVLRSMMRQALLNGSCTRAHISADVNDADTFWYCEEWEDVKQLEAQMRSERFTQFLSLIETGAQPPLLEFREVPAARGLEYIAAIRSASAESETGSQAPDDASHAERSRE